MKRQHTSTQQLLEVVIRKVPFSVGTDVQEACAEFWRVCPEPVEGVTRWDGPGMLPWLPLCHLKWRKHLHAAWTEMWPGHNAGELRTCLQFCLPSSSWIKDEEFKEGVDACPVHFGPVSKRNLLVTNHLCVSCSFAQCSQVSQSTSLDLSPLLICTSGDSLRFPAPDPLCGCHSRLVPWVSLRMGWSELSWPGKQD